MIVCQIMTFKYWGKEKAEHYFNLVGRCYTNTPKV